MRPDFNGVSNKGAYSAKNNPKRGDTRGIYFVIFEQICIESILMVPASSTLVHT